MALDPELPCHRSTRVSTIDKASQMKKIDARLRQKTNLIRMRHPQKTREVDLRAARSCFSNLIICSGTSSPRLGLSRASATTLELRLLKTLATVLL
jgi:hypothetical protein